MSTSSQPRSFVRRFSGALALLLVAISLIAPRASHAAGVIFVVPGGAGARTGDDWANASDLHAALAAADSGTELWVKAGIYRAGVPDAAGTGMIKQPFDLKSGVALYGGFSGTETSRSQRNSAANETILSGDLLGNDAGAVDMGNPTRFDNAKVVRGTNVDSTALIDGFIISGGSGNGNSPYGGGVDINQSSPTISHVTFRDNTAEYGGGLALRSGSNPTLRFVHFYNNVARNGGGMYIGSSSPTISQALFSGNATVSAGTSSYGSGIYTTGGSPTISHATFWANTSLFNGGTVYAAQSGTPIIRNSIVWGNNNLQLAGNPATVQSSLVQGGYAGSGNLSSDPLFVNAAGLDTIPGTWDDDLRLQPGSPAIDAGNTAFIPADVTDADGDGDVTEPLPFDLDGNPRAVAAPDMGAYELAGCPAGPRLYVNQSASGPQTSTTYRELRDALETAAPCANVTEIWVAQGTYTPTVDLSGDYAGRDAALHLRSGLALYGGFDGAAFNLAERNPAANPTILSGDLAGNDVGTPTDPSHNENSYHVLIGSATDRSAILDGFTVSGGRANGPEEQIAYRRGGGMYIIEGSPTIRNVAFTSNYASAGAGMHVFHGSPLLSHVTFINNIASGGAGGGLMLSNDGSNIINPVISYSRFISNTSMLGGGMMNIGGSATINHSIFSNNTAQAGGAAYTTSTETYSHVTFSGNIAIAGSVIASETNTITINNSIIWGNPGSSLFNGNPTIQHTLVQDGYPGVGNLSADPLFVDAAGADMVPGTVDDDLRLRSASPALNAGSAALIPADTSDEDGDGDTSEPAPLDLDGSSRVVGAVDLGPYERQITLIGPELATATYGSAYTHTFSATGAPTLTYALAGGTLPAGLTLSAAGTLAGVPTAAGLYTVTVAVSNSLGMDLRSFGLLVEKAPLTLTADPQTRVVGAANPALTASSSGFVNGDTAQVLTGSPSCSTLATPSSPPGSYPITCAAGSLSAANYEFIFVDGTLTIVQARLFLPLIGR